MYNNAGAMPFACGPYHHDVSLHRRRAIGLEAIQVLIIAIGLRSRLVLLHHTNCRDCMQQLVYMP